MKGIYATVCYFMVILHHDLTVRATSRSLATTKTTATTEIVATKEGNSCIHTKNSTTTTTTVITTPGTSSLRRIMGQFFRLLWFSVQSVINLGSVWYMLLLSKGKKGAYESYQKFSGHLSTLIPFLQTKGTIVVDTVATAMKNVRDKLMESETETSFLRGNSHTDHPHLATSNEEVHIDGEDLLLIDG